MKSPIVNSNSAASLAVLVVVVSLTTLAVGPFLLPSPMAEGAARARTGAEPNGPLSDLIISSAHWQMEGFNGSCVRQYGPPELAIRVKNIGAADAGAFVVRAGDMEWAVDDLAAGGVAELEPQVDPNGASRLAIADADDDVTESDETNNTYAVLSSPTWTPPPLCTSTPTPSAPPTTLLPTTAPAFMPHAHRDGPTPYPSPAPTVP